ncbi:hypothetical protein [Egicoccus halophilus]|uniref:Uncharacterized protein n=1 Tax=Egicoccus halophilus TaxID=1670830 RepID=A0A8J3A6Z2_9ACTN|nr:hypothetical protein [Egicoccus halophilus]GGI02629.1 hypothetical protein GCM10011354_01010 [Egicoccus halophilus]
MDPRMLMSAIPWIRRAWRMLPPSLRLPVMLLAAAGGIYYAITGREELKHAIQEAREGLGGAPIDQRDQPA